jgi:16S rRNA processing protein RimM
MNYLKVGFIMKPHGIKGELKVLPLTDNPARFNKIKSIFLLIKDEYKVFEINNIKPAKDHIIISFKECDSVEKAELLRNVYLFVEKKDGVKLMDNEFYTQDLKDCKVIYNEEEVGLVLDLLNFGANDNLLLKTKQGEIYYPFRKEYIKKIDIENKILEINQIEGFFD